MSIRRTAVHVVALLMAVTLPASAQQAAAAQPDSSHAAIRSVLRSFYSNLESGNWDALAAYVLSPKLLERRGAPGDLEAAAKGRARTRGSAYSAAAPVRCTSSTKPMVDQAVIHVDEDWAEASVPRCSGTTAGADEFRLLYFEQRWRFIYTDLFEAPASVAADH
jgi:hypothetical protein